MALEIEHKYLVISDIFEKMANYHFQITQGYLSRNPLRTVRVRIKDKEAYITIKGKTEGDTRVEYEYQIPLSDAVRLMAHCDGVPVIKERWIIDFEGYKWEVDRFLNKDMPVIAEIELSSSHHNYPLPPFVGKEVTGDPRFYNSNL